MKTSDSLHLPEDFILVPSKETSVWNRTVSERPHWMRFVKIAWGSFGWFLERGRLVTGKVRKGDLK